MTLHESLLELFDIVIDNLDAFTAFGTDNVIVVMVSVGVFIARGAIFETDFAAQSGLAQQLHGPINGYISDLGVPLLYGRPQLVDGHVPFDPEEDLENPVPRPAMLEPLPRYELFEDRNRLHSTPHILKMIFIFNYTLIQSPCQQRLVSFAKPLHPGASNSRINKRIA